MASCATKHARIETWLERMTTALETADAHFVQLAITDESSVKAAVALIESRSSHAPARPGDVF
jgi:hypothetical protein